MKMARKGYSEAKVSTGRVSQIPDRSSKIKGVLKPEPWQSATGA